MQRAAQLISKEVTEIFEWVQLRSMLSSRNVRFTVFDNAEIPQQSCTLMRIPHEILVKIIRHACDFDGSQIDWVQLLRLCSICREFFSIAVRLARRETHKGAEKPSRLAYGGQDGCDISMDEHHSLAFTQCGCDNVRAQRNMKRTFMALLRKEGRPTPQSSVRVTTRVAQVFDHAREAHELHFDDDSTERHDEYDEDEEYADRIERWLSFWLLKEGLCFVAALTETDVEGDFKQYYERSNFEWSSRKRGICLCGHGRVQMSEAPFAEVLASARFDIDEELRQQWREDELEDLEDSDGYGGYTYDSDGYSGYSD